MTPDEFTYLSGVLHKRSGLVVTPDKTYLLETRLLPLARRHAVNDLSGLVGKMRNGGGEPLIAEVVDAMTTNETFFFRDKTPFEMFSSHILPSLIEGRKAKRAIRIWCAACSTGQEPYTLAMLLKEAEAKIAGWRIEILATDLSKEAMDKARTGLYSQFEVQRGLPVQYLVKYFKQANEMWQIDAGLRAMVTYKPFNLLDPMAGLGIFDVVYCRNVLIYFDRERKADVLGRIRKITAPDGFLFLGGSETVLGITEAFRNVAGKRGLYEPA